MRYIRAMRQTTIHLPTPCHESWAAMTPASVGRHCAACQKTVVDFTRMTDSEVVTFLGKNASVSCGRFRESQLSRPLLAAAQPVAGWRRWAGAMLALLGVGTVFGLKAQAQAGLPVHSGGPAPAGAVRASQVAGSPVATVGNQPAVSSQSSPTHQAAARLLHGTVVDSATHRPLPWVQVLLAGTKLGVATDADGNFQLEIPASKARSAMEVRFAYLGYKPAKRLLPTPTDGQPLLVALAVDDNVLFAVGAMVVQSPQQSLPWYSPTRLRYRVQRLFQRH
ncbi:MAG: carboxypeptidase-like regulatory domain-containing protein [Janthinobacterium lividum]